MSFIKPFVNSTLVINTNAIQSIICRRHLLRGSSVKIYMRNTNMMGFFYFIKGSTAYHREFYATENEALKSYRYIIGALTSKKDTVYNVQSADSGGEYEII